MSPKVYRGKNTNLWLLPSYENSQSNHFVEVLKTRVYTHYKLVIDSFAHLEKKQWFFRAKKIPCGYMNTVPTNDKHVHIWTLLYYTRWYYLSNNKIRAQKINELMYDSYNKKMGIFFFRKYRAWIQMKEMQLTPWRISVGKRMGGWKLWTGS